MKQQLDGEAAWERFLHTGRVEDYLTCCGISRSNAPAMAVSPGKEDVHADYHQGLDRERTAYR